MEQPELLEAAGFGEVLATDVTKDFLETAHRWVRYASKFESELRRAIGDALFDEQQGDRKDIIAAIEQGLLSRGLFQGTKAE
jgi:hypothetical protein